MNIANSKKTKVTAKLTATSLILFLGLILSACSSNPSTTTSSTPQNTGPVKAATSSYDSSASGIPSFYTPPSPLPKEAPGTLIRYQEITGVPGIPSGATLYRILYHSETIYNVDIPESGYVVVPSSPAPHGGYPIMSWAHGTTGAAPICAPSLFNSDSGVYLTPGIASFLKAGFLVAATDYEGLGIPGGLHPYLLGESEGRAVLDAAKAAQQLPGIETSDKLFIYGHSQGGHSALFAGQLAPSYAPNFKLMGVVAAAPATNLPTILAVAANNSFQGVEGFVMTAAWTWSKTYKHLPASDLFTPLGLQIAAKYVGTVCTDTLDAKIANDPPSTIFLSSAASNPVVKKYSTENNPGLVKTDSPMLIVQGTADTTVLPFLTDSFVQKQACPLGDTVDYLHVTGATHGTVVFDEVSGIVTWMQNILSGQSAPNTCALPNDLNTVQG